MNRRRAYRASSSLTVLAVTAIVTGCGYFGPDYNPGGPNVPNSDTTAPARAQTTTTAAGTTQVPEWGVPNDGLQAGLSIIDLRAAVSPAAKSDRTEAACRTLLGASDTIATTFGIDTATQFTSVPDPSDPRVTGLSCSYGTEKGSSASGTLWAITVDVWPAVTAAQPPASTAPVTGDDDRIVRTYESELASIALLSNPSISRPGREFDSWMKKALELVTK